jgi:hypothetical protein
MHQHDFDPFCQLLDDVWGIKGQPLTAGQKAIYFRALAGHSLEAVRGGLDAHVKDPDRGRFLPMPADVIAQIAGAAAADGRPGPEEAWAAALQGRDEAATIVWTEEMSQAWGIASPVLCAGDEVGARMAFKEAYQRLVAEARTAGCLPRWSASLGHDPEQRARALTEAVAAGRLPAPDVAGLLPPPGAVAAEVAPDVRQALLALRERLAAQEPVESADAADKRRTADLRAAAQQRVDQYQRGAA